jgi:hypothetical protein
VAATGPAGAAGPVTTGGAAGASGAGACATGGGESNAGACTGAPKPAEGVVGGACGTCGSVGANGAGGTASTAAENGAPACIPLSKLCINSPGVRPWAGFAGVSGAPGNGALGPPGTDGMGAPGIDGAGVDIGGAAPVAPGPCDGGVPVGLIAGGIRPCRANAGGCVGDGAGSPVPVAPARWFSGIAPCWVNVGGPGNSLPAVPTLGFWGIAPCCVRAGGEPALPTMPRTCSSRFS